MEHTQLIELWHRYLAAFNSHSLLALKEYYDPTCHIIVDGQVLAHDRDSMMVNYTDIWAKMIKEKKTPVEAIEIRPIENGLSVVLREGSNPKLATVEYLYNEKGLQIAHILDT
jgi:hypothetical protein